MVEKRARVAVDAMGGDYGPPEMVKGALEAARSGDVEVILVGAEDAIRRELGGQDLSKLPLHVANATEVVAEHEPPVAGLRRKPDASILVATRLVKEGRADGLVSMGSTGAVMVSAVTVLGNLEGIKRPTLGDRLLGFTPDTILFDGGTNTDCRPRDLMSFALIGSVVARKMLNIDNPTVGLISTGVEEGKGNLAVKGAYQLLKESDLNFIGNAEGSDIPVGKANVLILDGFTGNVLLKFCEAFSDRIGDWLRETLDGRLPAEEIDAIRTKLFRQTHTADVNGGGMIYGVDGIVWVGHGRAKAAQVAQAIGQVRLAAETGLLRELKVELAKLRGVGE